MWDVLRGVDTGPKNIAWVRDGALVMALGECSDGERSEDMNTRSPMTGREASLRVDLNLSFFSFIYLV